MITFMIMMMLTNVALVVVNTLTLKGIRFEIRKFMLFREPSVRINTKKYSI